MYCVPGLKDLFGDFEKVKSLLEKSKEELTRCDLQLLNETYNGWGDIISGKFIPAIDLMLAGTESEGDRIDLIRADALIADIDSWFQKNWDKVLLRLHEKYGYEIK